MKINFKINLLILISIAALVGTFILSEVFKRQELRYYQLAENAKRLQVQVLNALVYEKNYEKNYTGQDRVFSSQGKAVVLLETIDKGLLGDTGYTDEIKARLGLFKTSFKQMTLNSNKLLAAKETINQSAKDYAAVHLKGDAAIDRAIAEGYLYEDIDITVLQELKNVSVTAFSHISEILLLVNQDLILSNDIHGFDEKYGTAMVKLGTQKKNVSLQVGSLKAPVYQTLSKQLDKTYMILKQVIPKLRRAVVVNHEISRVLQSHETDISAITNKISQLSEKIRLEKSKTASSLQLWGQLLIICILMSGAYFLGKSITQPLDALIHATQAMKPGQEKGGNKNPGIDTSRKDELGVLARQFDAMRDSIRQKIRDLEKLNHKVEAQNRELMRTQKLKDQILSNTSHELRTPINGIIGIAESMMDGVTGPQASQARENLAMIASSGRRLANLVNDILDYAKLGQRRIQLQCTPFYMRDVAEIVLKISRPLADVKGLVLVNEIGSDLPAVAADENRVQQILYNLVGNAVKFTSEGEIRILAEASGEGMKISVSDTGIGISKEKTRHIFEAFEQADGSTEREYGGTGLGLSITKKLVEIHGGTMGLISQPGQGSIFSFTLPISDEIPKSEKSVRIPAYINGGDPLVLPMADSQAKLPTRGNCHILVVDDEPVNLKAVSNQLTLERYRVSSAATGRQALAYIEKQGPPDLLLLDVMMPKLSGYDVLKQIRETYSPSELPVILLTAKNMMPDLVLGFEYGANDYLTKPFFKDELLARIKSHLDLSRAMHEQRKMEAKLVKSSKLEAMGILAGGIAHDFNNILSPIMGYAQMMLRDVKGNEDYERRMGRILKSAQRARDLVFQILTFASQDEVEVSRMNIVPLVKESLKLLRSTIPASIRFDSRLDTACPQIMANPTQISQLLMNLTINAFHAVEHDGDRIQVDMVARTLSSEEGEDLSLHPGTYLVLRVEDNGYGMEKEVVARIFDPYFTTKAEGKGTGLGLSVVHGIMETHGAAIKVASLPGQGTVFSVYFPGIDLTGVRPDHGRETVFR